MKRCYLLFSILLVPLALLGNAALTFEAEELSITLAPQTAQSTSLLWTVQGDYYFGNLSDTPISSPIAFPIPSTDAIGTAMLHELVIIEPEEGMRVTLDGQNSQVLVFTLELPSHSFARLRISYSQDIHGKEAVYVLKSANTWGRPLPYSGLSLRVNKGLTIDVPGFPNPLVFETEEGTHYRWEFYDAVFENDFRVLMK